MDTTFDFKDVELHRQASQPLERTIAPVLTPNMFKSARCFDKPASKDFSHRLTLESSSRVAATLKAGGAFLRGDTISLGTGRPSARYFPISGMSFDFLQQPESLTKADPKAVHTSIGKYDLRDSTSNIDLAVVLNYGYSSGSEQLVRFITEHVDVIHNPPYLDWQISLTLGNTSALDIAMRTFCTRGDYILTEEYTYPGATEAMPPLGLRAVPIKMDADGLSSEHLDAVLTDWDENKREAKKPFLLYLIPTGQNPTGVTQPLKRRKEIYSVAEKHDLYIIEDDPYFFLQLDPLNTASSDETSPNKTHEDFLRNLIPSYLSIDYSGRVLRLDSTSKMIAPGLRCGWMTGSAHLIEKFLYYHDVGTVSPSGLSQLALYKLLDETWGHSGLLDWFISLQSEYSSQRDILVKACQSYLPSAICSWNIPTAGMFQWIKINWEKHPIATRTDIESSESILLEIEDRLFEKALENGVMCCKGSTFLATGDVGTDMYFRTTFASASPAHLEEAIKRFGAAIHTEFEL